MAVEVARRWSSEYGIRANAVNPGAIATNLQKHTGGLRTPKGRGRRWSRARRRQLLLPLRRCCRRLLAAILRIATRPALVSERPEDLTGVASYALDAANAERLWNMATLTLEAYAGGRA